MEHSREEFQIEKDQLQEMAAEHKAAYEKVDSRLQSIQEEYNAIAEELQEKHDEIESYRGQLQTGDSNHLLSKIKELEGEIEQAEIEKGTLQDQIDGLQRDAAQLIEKDGKVAKERSEERKTLQNVYPHCIF